jgi:hypothetical protein
MAAKYPYKVETDVSSWDGSQHDWLLEILCDFYRNKVKNKSDEFDIYIDNFTSFKFANRGGNVNGKLKRGWASGYLGTSHNNSLIHMMIASWVASKMNSSMGLMVLGDDGVGFYDKFDADVMTECYDRLGWEIDILKENHWTLLNFVQDYCGTLEEIMFGATNPSR